MEPLFEDNENQLDYNYKRVQEIVGRNFTIPDLGTMNDNREPKYDVIQKY